MSKYIKILLPFIVLSMLASCEMAPCLTKDAFITSSQTTYDSFKKDQETMSETDWINVDNKQKTYLSDCYPKYKKDMSPQELKKFWLNTSQYFIKRAYKGPEMTQELQDLYGQHFEVYLEEVGGQFADKFKELININVDETIDKLFDILGKERTEK